MSSSVGLLNREWRRYCDSFDAGTIVDGCRPVATVVPVLFWVAVILVSRFAPAVHHLIGLTDFVLPIIISVCAGAASILSWIAGKERPNLLGFLQLIENGFYSAAILVTAVATIPPASYVFCGVFALSCLYWGISFSFTLIGLLPLVVSPIVYLVICEVDPVCITIMGVGILVFYTMGNLTAHRRRHQVHALRSEDVLNQLEMLMSSCRSGVIAEMEVRMASVAHRVRTRLFAAADDVKELETGGGTTGQKEITPVLRNLETSVSIIDGFLDGLRSSALAAPSFHLPKIASNVETADPANAERLEWGALPDVWVSGEEGMMSISLRSLIDNSFEAGAKSVRVDAEEQAGAVAMMIVDDGPGLPAQVRNNLFRPYNTFGKSRGVGLGIYLAAQIVRSAGGDIELVATGTRGTRFKVTLPVVEPARAVRLDSEKHAQLPERVDV